MSQDAVMVRPGTTQAESFAAATAAYRQGDVEKARRLCQTILAVDSTRIDAWRLIGIIAHQSGRNAEAEGIMRRVAFAATSHASQRASDIANLGAVLRALGRPDEAEDTYRQAIATDPFCSAAHNNLANLLAARNRIADAEAAYRAAIAAHPAYGQAWNGLGDVLQRAGHLAEAVDAFNAAVRLVPNWIEARVNLGVALLNQDRGEEAAQCLRAAVAMAPDHAPAHGNLGAVFLRAGLPIRAEAALRRAIDLAPKETRWQANLAVALQMQGRHTEAEALCRAVLAQRPDYPSAHGNLLFAMNYHPDLSAEAIFAEYRAWDARHAQKLQAESLTFNHDRQANRRLRVGYVSPDFRHHAVAFFAEPLLAAHDRTQVEIFCYAEVGVPDAVTHRFRSLADHWRSTVGLSDTSVAELIRADEIDVLVDLAGHTAANRLLAFAHRAAPVQIASLLGHGYTSGLSAMDGFIADAELVPVGSEHLFSETIVRMPRVPIVYAPPAGMPDVTALPALHKGRITFGHFGRPERLNEKVIAAWARVLAAVPGSHLMLNTRALQEGAFRDRIARAFAEYGIGQERLELGFTTPQTATWAAYGEIDIALDPFPHNAGTTTIEALWLGVPVVSLAGRPSVGRFGASILGSVGLANWVAADVDAYVERAVTAARDLTALALLRTELRARVAASPLCDAPGLARATEQAYRALWQRWCGGDAARLRVMFGQGAHEAAEKLASRMIARDSNADTAWHVRGLIAHQAQRHEAAAWALAQALVLSPDDAEMHSNHAAILRTLGRLDEAEQAARCAVALNPANPAARNNLGNILRDAGKISESEGCYRTAIALDEEQSGQGSCTADAWSNLAWVLSLSGQAHAAEDAARSAIAADATHANGWNNLGLALMRQGRLADAEAALRQALSLRPDFALPHSNILFCLNYRTDLSDIDIAREYRAWDRAHARPLAPPSPDYAVDPTPRRRLRIGYVSPDFRHHAAAFFAEPLLAAHDRAQVEVVCYAEVTAPDQVTDRFRQIASEFVSTVGMSDAALAERIRADKIDVLVDLAGHTGGNRLLVFARKPAPVQIATMLGLGTGSGLSAMDAFVTDIHLVPENADELFVEPVVRLPRIPLCYAPPPGMPDVVQPPSLTRGHITFGHFGRTVRLNERVIATWSRILDAVPGARLVLNSAPFAEADGRDQFAARFAARGIGADRLDLIFTSPQPRTWVAYGDIDIALDPFPHNAGTTTMEALWQGIPVITLASRPGVGRIGASLLHAVGLDDWVTHDEDRYVARAVAAAQDIGALTELRAGLRIRVKAGPLADAVGLAREMERVYGALWNRWQGSTTQGE